MSKRFPSFVLTTSASPAERFWKVPGWKGWGRMGWEGRWRRGEGESPCEAYPSLRAVELCIRDTQAKINARVWWCLRSALHNQSILFFPPHVCVIWAWLAPNRSLSCPVWEAGGTTRGSAVEREGSCSPGASVGAAHYIPNPESHHIWEDNRPDPSHALFCLLFLYPECHVSLFSLLPLLASQAVLCCGDVLSMVIWLRSSSPSDPFHRQLGSKDDV